MSLRVLEDDPGFAILSLDRALDAADVEISVRSLSEPDKGYLAPGGQWRKTPHYFTAERVENGSASARLRVGPDIVNHLDSYTRVEIATRDGNLRESTMWQNAVPAMQPRAGYAMHRPDAGEQSRPQHTKFAQDEEGVKRDQGVGVIVDPPDWKKPFDRRWLLVLPALLAIAGLAALALLPSLRCSLFGLGCPDDPEADARKAMSCANTALAHAPCEVEACFAELRRKAPLGADASALVERARLACALAQKKAEIENKTSDKPNKKYSYADAKACSDANPCIAVACFENYRADASSSERAKTDGDIATARKLCDADQSSSRDGVYSALVSPGCGATTSQRITVTVKGHSISWLHNMAITPGGPLVANGWDGVIGEGGGVSGAVSGLPGFDAAGRFDDKITLRGPACRPGEIVTLRILTLLRRP